MEPARARDPGSAPAARTELLDAERFELARVLRAVHATALAELQLLDDAAWVPWFENGYYEGTWVVFPLAFGTADVAHRLGVDIARNRARCPRTAAAFDAFGRQLDYGFSRMMPGAHVIAHRDVQPANV